MSVDSPPALAIVDIPYAEVIGEPIAQSLSPAIHGFWLERLGIKAAYRACLVPAEQLADYFALRRADPAWRGCNVTMPHKQAVIAHLDRLDPSAERVGAVNTVVRAADGTLTGHNTDVIGVIEPLRGLGTTRPVLIIGAGGAARGAVVAVREADFGMIRIVNRSLAKAQALAELAGGGAYPLDRLLGKDHDAGTLIINATSMGMHGQNPVPIDLASFPADTVVFDMVYAPLATPLLVAARARGLATIDGLTMLIGQAAAAFALFFGVLPPRDEGPNGQDAALRARLAP